MYIAQCGWQRPGVSRPSCVQGGGARGWLAELGCRSAHEQYTNSVVVSAATPDFSMPYIVCALSSSLLAVYAGLVVSALVRRPRAAAAQLLSQSGKWKRKVKVAVVLAAFAVLVPYLDTEWRDWLEARAADLGIGV